MMLTKNFFKKLEDKVKLRYIIVHSQAQLKA